MVRKKKENVFIVMWCSEGLECIIPVDSQLESTAQFKALAGDPDAYKEANELSNLLHVLKIRAQANPQRHYEIYVVSTDGIDEKMIREMFNDSPQMIVDLIREKGKKILSNRNSGPTLIK